MCDPPCIGRIGNAAHRGLGGELAADASRRLGIGEEDGSERHVRRSGGDQVERVTARGHPSHAHDRERRRPVGGPDGGERDRPERRSREPADRRPEVWPERALVEGQAPDRVHQGEPVGARVFHGAGGLGHVPARRRELRVEQLAGRGAAGGDDLRRRLRRLVDVRTREIELDRHVLEERAGLRVLGRREPADRDPERDAELAQPGKRLGEEAVAARVREPDRVQHPDLRLGDPDRRVPAARKRRDRLRDEGVERAGHLWRGQSVEAARGVQEHKCDCTARE